MKKINLLFLAIIILASCKKNDTSSSSDAVTVTANGEINISDADGAFYTIVTKSYDDNSSSSNEIVHNAVAWLGKYPSLVDAGTIKVNDKELNNFSNYYSEFGFASFDPLFTSANAKAIWNVQGNAASGISAFTHTDNEALPTPPAFTLPASINKNNSLTITHTATGGNLGVIYSLVGENNVSVTKFVANSSSSYTFTADEVKKVAVSGYQVGAGVMPVSYTTANYNGKKYYFVKQLQYTRPTNVQ